MDNTYTVTLRVSADEEIDAGRIEHEIYTACEDVPFSFDITSIEKGDRDATD
ncbi:hypothetical protein IU451_28855 [Nocardia cyriacigeorgica]|uniref:hypothetical protein n=1 Tax=Nocardia cyriacigeorgica TaxID=135487 RepID=UPI001895DB57|nr:hypothetical protein [Nocardia cyriacigeorgica]MBF6326513.1 hypothetical protein [Nocardia cyriacigeorgica]